MIVYSLSSTYYSDIFYFLAIASAVSFFSCFLLYWKNRSRLLLYYIIFQVLAFCFMTFDFIAVTKRIITLDHNGPVLRILVVWLQGLMFGTGWLTILKLTGKKLNPGMALILTAAGLIYPLYAIFLYMGMMNLWIYFNFNLITHIASFTSIFLLIRLIPEIHGEMNPDRKELKVWVVSGGLSTILIFFFWFESFFNLSITDKTFRNGYSVDNFNSYLTIFIYNVLSIVYIIRFLFRGGLKNTTRLKKSDFVSVTSREKEIIAMLEKGLSNGEIAAALFISVPTVKTHLYNLYQKFGVKNRTGLCYRLKNPE